MNYDPELLQFEPKGHKYTYDGVKVDSVTTIVDVIAKPALVPWSAKIAAGRFAKELERVSARNEYITAEDIESMRVAAATSFATDGKEGARLGTLVHRSIEEKIVNGSETPAKAMGYVRAFDAWYRKEFEDYEVVAIEHRLYNPDFQYAGTADMVLRNRTTQTIKIADWKTSKRTDKCPSGIYAQNLIQVAAYAEAWNSVTTSRRDLCVETCVVNLADDETYKEIVRDTFDISQEFQVFRQAMALRSNVREIEQEIKSAA